MKSVRLGAFTHSQIKHNYSQIATRLSALLPLLELLISVARKRKYELSQVSADEQASYIVERIEEIAQLPLARLISQCEISGDLSPFVNLHKHRLRKQEGAQYGA